VLDSPIKKLSLNTLNRHI